MLQKDGKCDVMLLGIGKVGSVGPGCLVVRYKSFGRILKVL